MGVIDEERRTKSEERGIIRPARRDDVQRIVELLVDDELGATREPRFRGESRGDEVAPRLCRLSWPLRRLLPG